MKRRRIGLLTGGGDCAGLNAVIRAVVKTAIHELGMEVVGFRDGFRGLVEDNSLPLGFNTVSNILSQGGTILGTSSRDNLFGIPAGPSQKILPGRNCFPEALRTFRRHELTGVICIGGDGTLTVAYHLQRRGIPVIGVPKTIDNDVRHTDLTFGFDSACSVATEALDRLRTTASSQHRAMVLEVMGRNAGWIGLEAGMAGGADVILIPEIPFRIKKVYETVLRRSREGRRFSLVVAAEGAHAAGEKALMTAPAARPERPRHTRAAALPRQQGEFRLGRPRHTRAAALPRQQGEFRLGRPRLGGIGMVLSEKIERETGLESRAIVLGHLQRGGAPTFFDRVLATRFGYAAACLAAQGRFGRMVSLRQGKISTVDLKQVSGRPRNVPRNSPLLAAARAVGTSFCA